MIMKGSEKARVFAKVRLDWLVIISSGRPSDEIWSRWFISRNPN